MTSLIYQLPDSLGLLELSESVLAHFEANKQRNRMSCEAGGQLFAQIDNPGKRIKVVDATGPRSTDRRSIFGYVPDRVAEREEIFDSYSRGLHFVGDWHTHRQLQPLPSATDNASMREMVMQSAHDLSGFIMVIVGQACFPGGLCVSFHSKAMSHQLVLVN
ncbi:Mov34/MPN/PAD-1 family protein [Paraperlucidibaca sp.]|uniref:Mov34/MPN/PAD-1 family protein n=1 Tax=Paraperlucidibaca sp. TaxID=2708021 RepID=UPI0030F412F7